MRQDLRKNTICIVEADADAGELLGEVFSRKGYDSVCIASSYLEAICAFEQRRDEIWLILLDDLYVSGKVIDFQGPEIISYLKETACLPVALILMSAAMREDQLDGLQHAGNDIAQMHGYFRKPLRLDTLLEAAEAAMLSIANDRAAIETANSPGGAMTVSMDAIREVKKSNEQSWLALDGVTAVGIGLLSSGQAGIIINVTDDPTAFVKQIPGEVNGVEIEIRKSGEIRAF